MPCVLQLETNDNFGSFPGTQSTVAESNATFWTLSRPSTAFLWLSSLLSGSETHADATCSEKSVERLLTPEEWARKQTAIERCLRGGGGSGVNESNVDSANDGDDDADAIDLWHLRELALAPGGLLDPSLRKRAWPILTAALPHSHVVAGGGAVTQPSSADLIRLHRDVKHTVWNVQEHFVTQQRKLSMEAAAQIKKKRRVSFAPELTDKDEDEKKQEDEAESEVAMVLSLQGGSPTSTATTEEDDSPTATGPTTGTGAESPFSLDGITEGSVGTSDTPSTTASHLWSQHHASQGSSSYGRRVKWRKANKKEQTIVGNVVTSCLRTAAPESQAFEDDRFHYYTGLHDLTALIMINLESPSLSSLVLYVSTGFYFCFSRTCMCYFSSHTHTCHIIITAIVQSHRSKLAVYHLRDAMRKERAVLETALQLTLFPLLKQVDPVLYDHIVVQAGLTLPTFALTWISNWFATDVTDITAASRLLDVFVVSHPTTPLYLAVGMLTCHRQRILQCKPILHAVYTAVRTLPLLTILNDDAAAIADDNGTVTSAAANAHHTVMANVEHVISTALDYMYVDDYNCRFYYGSIVLLANTCYPSFSQETHPAIQISGSVVQVHERADQEGPAARAGPSSRHCHVVVVTSFLVHRGYFSQ